MYSFTFLTKKGRISRLMYCRRCHKIKPYERGKFFCSTRCYKKWWTKLLNKMKKKAVYPEEYLDRVRYLEYQLNSAWMDTPKARKKLREAYMWVVDKQLDLCRERGIVPCQQRPEIIGGAKGKVFNED